MSDPTGEALQQLVREANRGEVALTKRDFRQDVCVCEMLMSATTIICGPIAARRLCHHFTGSHPGEGLE